MIILVLEINYHRENIIHNNTILMKKIKKIKRIIILQMLKLY